VNAVATRLQARQPRSLGSIPGYPQRPDRICVPSTLVQWVVQALCSRVIRLLLEAGLLHPYYAGGKKEWSCTSTPLRMPLWLAQGNSGLVSWVKFYRNSLQLQNAVIAEGTLGTDTRPFTHALPEYACNVPKQPHIVKGFL
jgi:hypothetical protein